MGFGWEMGLGGWAAMGIWTLVLVVMVWFITRSPNSSGSGPEPEEILRTRFARGEITQVEYEQACRLLVPEKEKRA